MTSIKVNESNLQKKPWNLLNHGHLSVICKYHYSQEFYEIIFSDINQCWTEKINSYTIIQDRFQELNPGVEIQNEKFLIMLNNALSDKTTTFSLDNEPIIEEQPLYEKNSASNTEINQYTVLFITIHISEILELQWKFYGNLCDAKSFSDNLLKPLLSFNGLLIQEIKFLKSLHSDQKNKDLELFHNIKLTETELKETVFSPYGHDLYSKYIEHLNTKTASIDIKMKAPNNDKINLGDCLRFNTEDAGCSDEKKKKIAMVQTEEERKRDLEKKLSKESYKKLNKHKKFVL